MGHARELGGVMNVVELHPEELIDREARGVLDAVSVARLEAHCARCVACRYERTMRAQFAGALGEREELPEHTREREPECLVPPARGIARGHRIWLWVAASAALVGGAHLIAPEQGRSEPARTGRTATFERASMEAHVARGREAVAKSDPVRGRPSPSAAMLFERANRARARGQYALALEAYRRLQRRYPSSQEARISYVAMGRMQLDRADAAGALASFDRYEARGNVDVDAVVMAGRALALDELGAGSSLAWAALLASHPDTPYAAHARLRVAARSL